MAPVYLFVEGIVALFFPNWAGPVHWVGHEFFLSTNLSFGAVDGRVTTLAAKADFLTFGIGWPLIVALLLASDARRVVLKIVLSTVVLWLPQTAGILVEFLYVVYVRSGLFAVDGSIRYLIAVLFQLMIMVVPPLAPVLVWLWIENRFVKSMISNRPPSSA